MEKIDPLPDHLLLDRFAIGDQVKFRDKNYTVLSRTTLASGEPALILQGEGKQFVLAASQLLQGVKETG
ncbi:MAG: hypothetical protein ACE5FB_03015 [Candidatus Binatia bacterium]